VRRARPVLALILVGLAHAGAGAQDPERYHAIGVVQALLSPPSSLHASRPVIVIQHEPIAGLMNEAMSMPFLAASADLFRALHVGDRIAFTLQVTPDALLVVEVERVGAARRAPAR
jgi:Cu/Ag efflux protein CusF